ncbi:MAG TPA: Ig-like domain-containing protein, partial [Chthoniobacteraceae bacterium]|nr:Ig-like domain-containing protein [Chthoniobacteraceae bacterium]
MAQNGEVTLTRLDGQTLPLRLPFGWSPLQSFWILSEENFTASASLAPSDNILGSDTLAFVKLRESDPAWIVTELLSGAGTNAVTAQLNGSGAYALVVADRSPTAPPSPQGGKALLPTSFSFSSSSPLKAGGKVTPSVATASRSPEAITAQAEVIITNLSGGMPSGLMFHAELLEEYRLSDGGTRTPPRYENFLTTYQRPGDGNSATLHSFFSLRPLFLFGPEELEIATLNVDVMASADFAGAVLNSTGGAVASGRVRIRAGVGDIFGQQAIQLRAINPTNFASIAGSHAPEAAFELAISGVASGRRLSVQLDAATPNSSYVLGRVLYDAGQYGIQPIERIATDAAGAFRSTEPITGDRLDAITGAGQYVILKTASPQNLIIGQTRNSSGQLASAMPVRITGQPWLTFSGTNGSYKLIAPSGNISVSASEPVTGDAGESAVVLNQPVTTVNLAVGAHGPRAILLSPTVTTNVSRVTGIQIGFNEPINPGTLDSNGVELIEANGQVVPATVVLNLRNTVVTILPSDPLSAGTTFFLRLSTNITDSAGLRIEGETEFTFETRRSVARADFAKLTIFEPGATNIPANIRSQLVGFDPIVHSESVVAAGSPGTAEGEVPVILVNDNTGETSTVLSKPDGSFFGFIEAAEDEFISAVFVNANGTRTTVPASRQNFDDGRVGLYRSGGILEAESDGGPVQVIVQPEAIPTRATFALDVVGLAEVLQAASGVAPDGAAFAAEGLKLRVEGQVEGDVQVKFPVDPAKLPLPPGTDLSEAAFALAAIRKVGGETGYEILDELTFQTEAAPARILAPGMLAKRSPAFLGILGGGVGKAFIVFEQIVIPLVVGTKRFAVNGRTMEGFIDGTGTQIGDPLGNLTGDPTSNFAASLLAQAVLDELDFTGAGVFTHFIELLPGFMARPLPGCFVTLKPARLRQVPDLQPNGRIKPGLVYTTSDRSGRFKLLGFAASEPFVVQAIHPRFEDKPAEPVIALTESQVLSPGDVRKFLFFISPLNSLRGANVFTVSSTPENPQPGQAVTVSIRKRAQTGAGAPSVNVAQDGAPVPLRPGQPVAISDVTISAVSSPTLEADGTLLWTLTVACPHPARISLRVTSEGTGSDPLASANNATLFHTLTFLEQRPPLPPEDVAKADDADRVGPFVQRISPETGSALVLGQPLEIQFNEPISKAILNHAGELIARPLSSGTTVTPVVRLSDDQRTLFLSFAGAVPGATYEVTLGAFLKDLAQNPFDSDPSQSGDQGQPVPFRTITLPAAGILPEVGQGGGSTIVRNHMFVLDRQGSGSLKVFDISNPAEPTEVGRVALPGTPRDLIFIPQYSYVLEKENSPVQTNDLLAVIGGALGTQTIDDDGNLFFSGQYLRIYNISNPANPTRVVFAQISLRNTAVTKIEWHPPNLVYLEKGSDLEAVSFINLQEFLFGFTIPPNRVLAADRIEGVDLTEDGDFVDDGERIPHPPAVPNEFFGKRDTFTIEGTNQKILDFAYDRVTDMLSVVVSDGFPVFAQTGTPDSSAPRRPAAYRTLRAFDRDIRPPGELPFELGAHPKRVFLLRGQMKHLVNGQELLRRLALVSLAPDGDGIPKLAVIDVAIPEQPILLNKIPLPESTGGLPQTVNVRSDGVLEMATSSSVVRLLIERLFEPMPAGSTATDLHPSITAVIPGAGTGAISLDGNDAGVLGTALGGKNQVVFTGPSLEFLRFPTAASLPQPDLLKADPALARSEFAKAQVVSTLVPARFRAAAGVPSTLAPPRPELHYYVRVRAPGGLGTRIRIAIQSLNEAGEPLRNKGKSFPPVQALGADAATSIGQTARADCDAAISELTAIRLSDDRTSDLYNTYLTEPLALTYEKMSIAEVNALRATPKRQIFWSGSFLRAFIDSSHLTDPGLGAFSATIDTERRQLSPGAVVVAATLPAFYILGDNPPPASGDIRLPGTFGTLSAHNGEFRHETIDASLPGRRMPIVFQRATGGQDLYSGPFGRGWDHNYNQRVIFLDKELFAADAQMPLIVRSTLAENTTAKPEDLVLQTGGGRTILFKKQPTVPSTISSDPLVQELQWLGRSDAVFLPDLTEKGVFDLCFKFKDGQYARLTPDGRQ